MSSSQEEIVKKRIEFAREVVKLARQHGVSMVRLDFEFGFDVTRALGADAGHLVTAGWSVGRHGDESRISLQSTWRDAVAERDKQ